MPAIQLARLKNQLNELAGKFNDVEAFIGELHDLYSFYADRTRRPRRVAEATPLVPSYQVAPQVLRQLERVLIPKIKADPEIASALAHRLWKERWLETQLLAITVLGHLPPTPPERILTPVSDWAMECKEERLLQAMVSKGIAPLRVGERERLLEAVEDWLSSSELPLLLIGLRSLPPILKDENFENLPLIYRWISPLVREVDLDTQAELLQVIQALAKRSPKETAFFLKESPDFIA